MQSSPELDESIRAPIEAHIAALRESLLPKWDSMDSRIDRLVADQDARRRRWEELLDRKADQWLAARTDLLKTLKRLRKKVRRLETRQRRRRRGLIGWLCGEGHR